jgi:hypothetical protein
MVQLELHHKVNGGFARLVMGMTGSLSENVSVVTAANIHSHKQNIPLQLDIKTKTTLVLQVISQEI